MTNDGYLRQKNFRIDNTIQFCIVLRYITKLAYNFVRILCLKYDDIGIYTKSGILR